MNPKSKSRLRAIAIACVALLTVAACGGDVEAPSSESSKIPTGDIAQVSTVSVQGTALDRFEPGVADTALDTQAPDFTGQYFDGSEAAVDFGDGKGKIVLFVTHWCGHCQEEVKTLSAWFADNGVPSSVDVVTVSTGVDPTRPNYPPSTWFLIENWPAPVIRDSENSEIAASFGLSGYPYAVVVDGEGNVISRQSGTLTDAAWRQALVAAAS